MKKNDGHDESAYENMETAAGTEYIKTAKAMAAKEYLACLFIKQADQQQCGELKKTFVNDGLKGDSLFLETLKSAVAILKGWEPTGAGQQHQDNAAAAKNKNGVAFTQTAAVGKDTRTYFGCDEKGYLMKSYKKISKYDYHMI